MEPTKKEQLTPEQIAAAREAKKLAALEAKAAKIAKASAKSDQAQKWKDVQKKNQEDPSEAKAAKEKKKEEQKKKSGKPEKEKVVYVETPKGEKKILPPTMAPTYDVKSVENSWYDWWVQSNFFTPEYIRPGMTQEEHDALDKFVMVIPPPNVTGVLHIGHALTSSIQDTVVRFHRMHKKRVLWVPGMDHAGIATQAVVEKKLFREGITKTDLGREKFLEKVWEWKNEHGNHITQQLRRMGVSVDWNREVFTMDKNLSVAVNEAFMRFFDKGIIYRANRLVNWSCKLRTCISDIECDDWMIDDSTGREFHVAGHDKDKTYPFGYLWSFAYQVDEEGSTEEIIISTTRPETMLGDTAIAIHPDDERYKHFHGRDIYFKHPFVSRRIPLIYDSDLVKMEFGTGAVKVTPAHDPNDYDCGMRKKLEFITIFNEDGTTNSQCGEFSNMMRYDVRIALVKKLEDLGLFRGRKTHDLCIKKCSRSSDIVEPILKPQWWANMTDLAKRTMDLFHEKALTITPTSPHHQIWFSYMENIRPWRLVKFLIYSRCISRQLWWGHRIPAYLVWKKGEEKPQDTTSMEHWVIATSDAQAIEKAKAKLGCDEIEFEQDSDVLDTWFSSGLFPFSVMGWPNTDAEDFKKYYPTNFLETGYDILFFWVARMVMMGLELTGKLPFTDVFLHTLVRDAKGIKMTKSLGNVIDPICVIEGITLQGLHDSISGGNLAPEQLSKAYQLQKEYFPEGIKECGTDALRFTLLTYMGNKSINLDTKRIEGYRHFCNKLWNAMILSLMFFGPNYTPTESCKLTGFESPSDIWILSRLNATIVTLEESFKELDFGKFSNTLYMFWLYDFCDVYLEVCKPILFFKGEVTESITNQQLGTRATLYTVLDSGLKALHPIMPFITEELWQYLPRRPHDLTPSVCVSDYPSASDIPTEENAVVEFDFIQLIVKVARNLCLTNNMIKRGITQAIINCHTEKAKASVEKYKAVIITLAYLRPDLNIVFQEKTFPTGFVLGAIDETCDLYLNFNPEKK